MNALILAIAFAALPPIQTTPDAVVWKVGPPSLPAGTQVAVLEGDPKAPGIVTMRLRIPKGFRIPAHIHPADERVTVLSGTIHVAFPDDASAEQKAGRAFPAGSFYVNPKGMKHVVWTDDETVIQITVEGPWDVTYANPKDDPRPHR